MQAAHNRNAVFDRVSQFAAKVVGQDATVQRHANHAPLGTFLSAGEVIGDRSVDWNASGATIHHRAGVLPGKPVINDSPYFETFGAAQQPMTGFCGCSVEHSMGEHDSSRWLHVGLFLFKRVEDQYYFPNTWPFSFSKNSSCRVSPSNTA